MASALSQKFFPFLRALAGVLAVAWAVATVTFVLMRAIPGGPLSKERQVPAAVRAAIEARYHLDAPWWRQYALYLQETATGRFGPSYDDPGRSVGEIIAMRLPISVALGACSLVLSLALAFPLGVAAATRPGRWPDRLNALVAAAGVSIPSFILAALLLYVFAFRLRWLPASGWRTPADAVLPAVALAALPTAYMARLIRGELREVLGSEFLLAARAKGLSPLRVIAIHALPHTLAPVLAYLGPQAAAVMTGSFVVERIFNIPGIGQQFVTSISNRNYPMIMGVTLCYTLMLVVFNILADAVARRLDPRLGRRP
jgi:oligopeptide transport system permease protein